MSSHRLKSITEGNQRKNRKQELWPSYNSLQSRKSLSNLITGPSDEGNSLIEGHSLELIAVCVSLTTKINQNISFTEYFILGVLIFVIPIKLKQ